jgi:hypothetical protein
LEQIIWGRSNFRKQVKERGQGEKLINVWGTAVKNLGSYPDGKNVKVCWALVAHACNPRGTKETEIRRIMV